MDERTKIDYSQYRLEKAKRCLHTAELNFNAGDFEAAANRSYYAIFHSIRAILALDGVDFKRHSAVAAYFRKEYVKTGIFEVEYSDILGDSFEARGSSDYDDFYIISKERIERQIVNAGNFYRKVEGYISKRLKQ